MKAFITGSHAYGVPNENSDIDLVVLMSEQDKKFLRNMSKEKAIRFGILNLVICTSDEDFAAWKVGTEKMKSSSIKRDKKAATRIMDDLRSSVGAITDNPSGGCIII